VQWIPAWGHDRIYNMVSSRPDWCISRQRAWGVPLAMFVHKETGDPHPQTPELLEQVAELVAEGGIEAWFALNPRHLLGDEALIYEKSSDVMDVWFDSGTVHHVLPAQRPGVIPFPADIYLEGSDQHRGWFHSSLLVSVAGKGVAPYRQVLTHGFFVDEKGRKMSKSLGNGIDPREVIDEYGADALRFTLVAAAPTGTDIHLAPHDFKIGRNFANKLWNAARYVLMNVPADFEPVELDVDTLEPPDKWILHRLDAAAETVDRALASFRMNDAAQAIYEFLWRDYCDWYIEWSKPRLATPGGDAVRGVLLIALERSLRLLHPFMPFVTEELWRQLPAALREGDLDHPSRLGLEVAGGSLGIHVETGSLQKGAVQTVGHDQVSLHASP